MGILRSQSLKERKTKTDAGNSIDWRGEKYFNNNKYVGVVYSNNDENLTHHVAVYDMHGFTVMEKDFHRNIQKSGFCQTMKCAS